jgi:hypothetical protein
MTRNSRHFPEGGSAMIRIMAILGAGLIGLMHPMAAHAGPLDFTFTFTGTVPPGTVAGTVTGEIFGLTDNTTGQAAMNVVVDSAPAGLGSIPMPFTIFTDPSPNSFTVSNDAITSASFSAIGSASTGTFELDINSGIFNAFGNDQHDLFVRNTSGLAGVTFTPVAVPAPLLATGPVAASVTLLATGLATLWPLRRRLRRRAASA